MSSFALAPAPVGKPFTSVPVGEEIDSRSCVVAPTRPIFSPPSVTTVGGRDAALRACFAGRSA